MKHILPIFLLMFFSCQDNPVPSGPEPIGQLTGIVYDDSTQTPVEGISVDLSLNDVSEETDSLGVYTFDSLSVGRDTLTIFSDIHDSLSHIVDIMEGPQELNFSLDYNLGQIGGVVMNESLNYPIRDAFVNLSLNQVADTTDSLGQFALDSLVLKKDSLSINAKYYNPIISSIIINEELNETTYYLKTNSEFGCFPVEDTAKINIYGSKEVSIYEKSVWARFSKDITDTLEILPLLQEYNLEAKVFRKESISNQWTATLCIMDNALPQCHFTPWGKPEVKNFGSNDKVDYCFAVVGEGHTVFTGIIYFQFSDGTSQEMIDSLYAENGLLKYYQSPSIYYAFITPNSKLNPFDLRMYMKDNYSFINLVALQGPGGGLPGGSGPNYGCE